MEEIWKPISNYEGLYEISNLGRVKSYVKDPKGRILKQAVNKNGYSNVNLCKPGDIPRNFKVHRLVAEHFIPNEDKLPFVNHIDGNKSNNSASNLEWCTQSHNILEAYRLGLNYATGMKRVAKIKDGKIVSIYNSLTEASKELSNGKVNPTKISNISSCLNGRVSTAYGFEWKFVTRGFMEVPSEFKKNNVPTIMPQRGTSKSAGYDIATPVDVILKPNVPTLIWTDVCSYMQDDEVLTLHVRSSMGIKRGIRLANTVGIIDADYFANPNNYGNIGICLVNTTNEVIKLERGERIAQAIFMPYLVSDNCNTDKDRVGGIGSTTEIIKGEYKHD